MLASKENYEKLNCFISQLSEDELQTPFDFQETQRKKKLTGKGIKIYGMFWFIFMNGISYFWLGYILIKKVTKGLFYLNLIIGKLMEKWISLFGRSTRTSLEEATRLLEQSHREVLELIEVFSNDELFTKGIYKWTGGTSLGSYFVSSTSSHYDWALKKLKAHRKNCKG